jgi:hypothetical protein
MNDYDVIIIERVSPEDGIKLIGITGPVRPARVDRIMQNAERLRCCPCTVQCGDNDCDTDRVC